MRLSIYALFIVALSGGCIIDEGSLSGGAPDRLDLGERDALMRLAGDATGPRDVGPGADTRPDMNAPDGGGLDADMGDGGSDTDASDGGFDADADASDMDLDADAGDAKPDADASDVGLDASPVDADASDVGLDAAPADADAAPSDAGADADTGPSPALCRIPYSGGSGVGVGFPTPSARLKSTGTVRATAIFIDFSDAAATRTPQQVLSLISPGAENFARDTSYGSLRLTIDAPHKVWLRMPRTSSAYAASFTSYTAHRSAILEAVTLADPLVDFSRTDLIIVLAAPSASSVPFGPTWTGVSSSPIVVDGRSITNAVTSGADLLFWQSGWLNHEMGHSMGLPDLYDFAAPLTGFTRPYSLMDLINSSAPEPLAWERWQLGWLDDTQIACDALNQDLALTPIEIMGGRKAAIVRTAPNRAVVVESRRALGYDSALTSTGAVVSLVDGVRASGSGPIRVQNGQAALGLNQSVSVDGVTVRVVSRSAAGDTVRITRP